MRNKLRLIGVVLRGGVLGGILLCLVSVGAARAGSVSVAQPAYTVVGHGTLSTNGAYTYLGSGSGAGVGTLFDERTGQSSSVPADPDCGQTGQLQLIQQVPGSAWLAFTCSSDGSSSLTDGLYAIPSGPWHSISEPSECPDYRAQMGSCTPLAVGSSFVAYRMDCYHCQSQDTLVPTSTSEPQSRPQTPGNGQITNLNTPLGVADKCSTLSTSLDGDALADDGFVLTRDGILRRCGSEKTTTITAEPADTAYRSHLLVWDSAGAELHGMFLPSRRQFVITFPAAEVGGPVQIALTPSHLYLAGASTGATEVWRAGWPSPRSEPTGTLTGKIQYAGRGPSGLPGTVNVYLRSGQRLTSTDATTHGYRVTLPAGSYRLNAGNATGVNSAIGCPLTNAQVRPGRTTTVNVKVGCTAR